MVSDGHQTRPSLIQMKTATFEEEKDQEREERKVDTKEKK